MTRPYDDDRYPEWYSAMQKLIAEFLTTEGNTVDRLHNEIDNFIENVDVDE